MGYGLGFFTVRAATLVVTLLFSLVWTILLSVELFLLYDRSDISQRNFVGVLIFIDAITAVLIPTLLILRFRPWLDAARLLFLLLAHAGTAALFTTCNANFRCPTESNAEYKQCRSVNLAIMVCNWVIPGLLIWYAVFLGVMYYWRKEFPAEESAEKRLSDLPMMLPSRRPSTRRPSILSAALRPAPVAVPEARSSNPSRLTPLSQLSRPSWLLSSSPAASPYSPSSPQHGIAY